VSEVINSLKDGKAGLWWSPSYGKAARYAVIDPTPHGTEHPLILQGHTSTPLNTERQDEIVDPGVDVEAVLRWDEGTQTWVNLPDDRVQQNAAVVDTDFLPSNWKSMTWQEQTAWAESDRNPYPTGKIIGGDFASGDFRVEVDPNRRFTELWQRTYSGYHSVHDAAMGQSRPELIQEMPLNSLYSVFDYNKDVDSAGRWLSDQLQNAQPSTTPLWRGAKVSRSSMIQDWQAALARGEHPTMTLSPTPTSKDRNVAERYRDVEGGGTRVMFEFAPGTPQVDLDQWSDWANTHPEQIVNGNFQIVSVDWDDAGAHVVLEPVPV
jgi:hypothetical protein